MGGRVGWVGYLYTLIKPGINLHIRLSRIQTDTLEYFTHTTSSFFDPGGIFYLQNEWFRSTSIFLLNIYQPYNQNLFPLWQVHIHFPY